MPLGISAFAVVHDEVEDGRVVLVQPEVRQELCGPGYGSRLARGCVARRHERGNRQVPFVSSCAARHVEYGALLDVSVGGPKAGPQPLWTTISHAYRMHVQREFLISSAVSDLWGDQAGRAHAFGSTAMETVIEAVAADSACRARA
ncbi:hypothetical protein XH92_33165 [Bradyrhizobium sp. CCBAU 53421]|nr:hypothetical protein XH92_33165 [Bradyrhizobium sp. CCBAU 53421]